MNIKSGLIVSLAVAAVVPATALAGFPGSYLNDYEASVEGDPTADLGFDVHKVNGERVADRFDAGNIPFSCHDGSSNRETVAFPEDASLPVQDGRFEGKVRTETMLPYILKLEGELRSNKRASGVMSLRTRGAIPQSICYSGVLHWSDPGEV